MRVGARVMGVRMEGVAAAVGISVPHHAGRVRLQPHAEMGMRGAPFVAASAQSTKRG
jgi:hypothetical protein